MIETHCTTCGADFTPAPDAFRRGDWRTCQRCRDGPPEEAPGSHRTEIRTLTGRNKRPEMSSRKAITMITTEERQTRIAELRNEGIAVPPAVYGAMTQDRIPEDLLREWQWSACLWDRPTAQVYVGLEGSLPSLQEAWDLANESIAGSLALRDERRGREAEAQRVRDAEAAKRDADELEKITDRLRVGYFRIPGATEAMFQRALPTLLERHRMDAALAGPPEARLPLTPRELLAG